MICSQEKASGRCDHDKIRPIGRLRGVRARFMETSSSHELTRLLHAWSRGDTSALEKLTPYVYKELHRVAHHYMSREAAGHTLQTTALINETYARLIDSGDMNWENRAHFFGVCARLMRQILTDFARSRLSKKRGPELQHMSLDESLEVP